MLKAGDYVEIINPMITMGGEKYGFQRIRFVEKSESRFTQEVFFVGAFYSGIPFIMKEGDFRVLTPEEVKTKGLDEKSNLEPQEPNDGVKTVSQSRNRKPKQPYTKFLFVEDGSVDTDSLEKDLIKRNPEIKVVVYRQGATMPQLVDIMKD